MDFKRPALYGDFIRSDESNFVIISPEQLPDALPIVQEPENCNNPSIESLRRNLLKPISCPKLLKELSWRENFVPSSQCLNYETSQNISSSEPWWRLFLLLTEDPKNPKMENSSTAFLLDEDKGIVATCLHCISTYKPSYKNCEPSLPLILRNSVSCKYYSGHLLISSPSLFLGDFSLIQIKNYKKEDFFKDFKKDFLGEKLVFGEKTLKEGDDIVLRGFSNRFPIEDPYSFINERRGKFDQLYQNANGRFEISAFLGGQKGDSGAPVFNNQFELIGMESRSKSGKDFFCPISAILDGYDQFCKSGEITITSFNPKTQADYTITSRSSSKLYYHGSFFKNPELLKEWFQFPDREEEDSKMIVFSSLDSQAEYLFGSKKQKKLVSENRPLLEYFSDHLNEYYGCFVCTVDGEGIKSLDHLLQKIYRQTYEEKRTSLEFLLQEMVSGKIEKVEIDFSAYIKDQSTLKIWEHDSKYGWRFFLSKDRIPDAAKKKSVFSLVDKVRGLFS